MSQTITAIYEDGVLRPLTPLELPEHTEVQLQIDIVPGGAEAERHHQAVDEALIAAGLMDPRIPDHASPRPLSEAEREVLAYRIPVGPSLSEIILEERHGR